ncbi:Mini-ribonuclease 3 [Vitis vinifera]|uniref:Mini-ribonuclease 3 n=1 Tax=Vitis vinifera TaxID=29760 RepID=A0A438EW69_VITVI|nr:Mini-ribonuclease 3 [Vitis vinifera]
MQDRGISQVKKSFGVVSSGIDILLMLITIKDIKFPNDFAAGENVSMEGKKLDFQKLYARRHFLFPPLNMEEYNDRVMAVVRCEAQDALLQKLLDDYYLSEEERDVLRWGKNIGSAKTRTKKRAGVAVYNRASSLETLVGYLYLTDVNRLEEVMRKLGFSTDASTQLGLQETDSKLTLTYV